MNALFKFPKYEQHPIAIKLMPGGMDPQEFEALCQDVEARGVLMPVTLFQGKVLDGWHRYRAAEKSGTKFGEIEYKGKDPAGYIASVNILRRRLSSLQRALVGARLNRDHELPTRDVTKKLGISAEVLSYVFKAMDSGNTKLLKRIETDSDFTRGMLREELYDLGLLSPGSAAAKKVENKDAPPNSVFQMGANISAEAAALGLPAGDTDGIDGEDTDPEDIGDTSGNTGKKAADRKTRKPSITAAQVLADQFKSLMADEKVSFLQIIWPLAHPIAVEAKLIKPTKAQKDEQDEVLKALIAGKPAAKKTKVKA